MKTTARLLGLKARPGLLLALSGVLVTSAGHSQPLDGEPATAESAIRACRSYFGRLCRGIQPGQGRALACLSEHQSQLSAHCTASLATAQSCAAQARQLCGKATDGPAPDRAAMHQCLKQHREALSAPCRSQRAEP